MSEGVFVFNYIKSLPIEVVAYNTGHIGSAAMTAYLGASKRVASPDSTFLIHKAKAAPGNVGPMAHMAAAAHSLSIDDARTEAVLRDHMKLSDDQWAVFSQADLILSAQEALDAGAVHELGHFSPAGVLHNI